MTDVANKVVWITGASSGIGAACAKVFAEAGADIILSGRREDALAEVANTLPAETLVLPFEVTDYPALEQVVEGAWAWQGRVDVLINNAGISQRSLAVNTAPEVYTNIINIDLIAPI